MTRAAWVVVALAVLLVHSAAARTCSARSALHSSHDEAGLWSSGGGSSRRSALEIIGEGSDKCVSCDAAGRPFVEQPPAPAGQAAAPGSPRAPLPCEALKAAGFSSTLPVVIVDTGAQRITSWEDAQAFMTTCNATGGTDYSGPITINIRGSSSARYSAKKSFALKIRRPANMTVMSPANSTDDLDEDNSTSTAVGFMGFPPGKQFMLHGPENDMTLGMRNWLAYSMWRAMGHWTSRLQYCEVFLVLDGSAGLDVGRHYWGLYMAGEEIERGKDRVDVKKLKPDQDLSGGYILRYEHGKNKNNASVIGPLPSTGMQWLLRYPSKTEVLPGVVFEYLTTYLDQVEAAIWTQGQWRQLVDETALVDYLLGTEVTKNPDGYRGSVYAYKDRQGPLVLGPMWDYNEAFGLCCGYPIEGYQRGGAGSGLSGGSATSPQGWRFSICQEPQRCVKDPIDGVAQWYMRLWKLEPHFKMAAARRWQELRNSTLSNAWFSSQIDAVSKAIYPDAVLRNYAKWRSVLRQPDDGYTTDAAHFEGNVKQLSTWLALHLAWLDQQFSDVMAGKDNGAGMGTAAAGPAAAGPAGAAPVGPLAAVFGKLVGMMG